jgi:hypothetical protein
VSHEWHLLRSDYKFSGYAVFPRKAGGGRRSLEAKHLFPVPDAGKIDGCAYALDRFRRVIPNLAFADALVQRGEIIPHQVQIKVNEVPICFKEQEHGHPP